MPKKAKAELVAAVLRLLMSSTDDDAIKKQLSSEGSEGEIATAIAEAKKQIEALAKTTEKSGCAPDKKRPSLAR